MLPEPIRTSKVDGGLAYRKASNQRSGAAPPARVARRPVGKTANEKMMTPVGPIAVEWGRGDPRGAEQGSAYLGQ